MIPFRIGYGWDIHRLAPHRPLILGGVEISKCGGCIAHSDGDLIIHALIDAILGALALGDIGQWFPDNDARYQDCKSTELLYPVLKKMSDLHYQIGNVDITCCLEKPKIANFSQKIINNIAHLCKISPEVIGLKAKTSEQIGSIGRNEGAACSVVVALWKMQNKEI